ncbi:hypothetical protein [Plastoroseomonas hellenica]|uniref:hypothetical protein n=1 Tax=Plastoroseomonas hellenica TaxID=2687306 RepID=UPI001FE69332|nr:hypothetical protein [Plastoroseomonas hellenica]
MGRYVGRVIAARAGRRKAPAPFRYRHHGDLATIGRRSAVVAMDGVRLTGLLGWIFWSAAHVWYLIGFRSRVVVTFEWAWSYVTAQRGARLITREPRRLEQAAQPLPAQLRPTTGRVPTVHELKA